MPRKQRFKPSRKRKAVSNDTLVERTVERPVEDKRDVPVEPQVTNPERSSRLGAPLE
jgi:hypothetical protein